MTAPLFSIVVVAYGKRPYTERCLDSLDAALGSRLGADVELVLVDNGSGDDTPALFETWRSRATVVVLPANRDYAGGANAGVAAATGDVVVLLNNDTRVPAGALETLVAEARRDDVGLVGVRLVYPDGTLQHGGFGWLDNRDLPVRPYHLFHHEPGELALARCRYDLSCVTGACIAIPRSLFVELGGFDTGFVNGWEDVDLCMAVRERGLRVVYRGDVAVIHDEGVTAGRTYAANGNEARFRERWSSRLTADDRQTAAWFGARRWTPLPPAGGRSPDGAKLLLQGYLTGISPDGDEARALLRACAHDGVEPAARNHVPTLIAAAVDAADHELLVSAVRRPTRPSAALAYVDTHAGPLPANVKLLFTADAGRAAEAHARTVWVPSQAIADDAVARGADPDAVRVLAPCVDVPAGAGGSGVLALLPVHDEPRCHVLIDALRELADARVALLPSADLPWLAELRASLPGATWLAPVSTDAAAAAVAGRFDVVIAADGADRRQRRALVAAGTGAAPILLEEGPASELLGPELCAVAAPTAEAVAAAVRGADRDSAREARVRRVREACAPPVVAGAISARVAELAAEDDARPALLVIAAEPPKPDRDSGSLRRHRMLELLLDEGWRITYIARNATGFEQYVSDLEAMGIEVYANDPDKLRAINQPLEASPIDMEAILRERHYRFAILTPYGVAEQYLDEIRRWSPSTRVIVDTVDVHFLRELRGAELSGDPDGLAKAAEIRERERVVYGQADALIAVSADDRDVLRELAPHVPVGIVSNIHGPEPTGPGFEERDGMLFVGGFRHAPNADAVEWFAGEVLPHIRAQLPDAPVRIAGSHVPERIEALHGLDGIEVVGFVPSTEPWLAGARLSIAPLRYGAGVKGKIGEALAHGVPVVTTTIGAEGMPLEPERDVLVADDPAEFAAAVVRAYLDRELWSDLRRNGRERVLAALGPEPALRGWRELIERLDIAATSTPSSRGAAVPNQIDATVMTTLRDAGLAAAGAEDFGRASNLLAGALRETLDPELLNDFAVVRHALGEVADAEAVLHTTLLLDPTNDEARGNIAAVRAEGAPAVAGWRASETLGGPDPEMPERAFPGMPHSTVMAEHATRYAFALSYAGGRHVLDLGCGTGYGSEMLSWVAASVRGFDLWKPGGHERPAWPGGASLTYGHDLCREPLPRAEVAVAFEVIEHLVDAPEALRTVWSSVDTIVCSFPNPVYHGTFRNPYHVNDWTLDEFEHHLRQAAGPRAGLVKLHHLHQEAGRHQRAGRLYEGRDPEANYWIVVATAA